MANANSKTQHTKGLVLKLVFLAVLVGATVTIVAQHINAPYRHNEGLVFGTSYHITYQHESDLQPKIEARLAEVDSTFSMFNQKSLTSQFNRAGSVKPNKMLNEVWKLAQTVNRETSGAFDPTVAPLVNAWGFGFKKEQMPSDQEVAELLSHIGMANVCLEDGILKRTDPKTMLDFSAIAKGYGADAVAQLLREEGVTNFMIEIGGEVVASGVNEEKEPWHIGVTKPVDDRANADNELETVLSLSNKALATSGNYRNFYYKGGRKYAHTIDPKTGRPVQHNILSATVIADNCATADAYATAFMVVGLDSAQAILKRHKELQAYLICSNPDGSYHVWQSQ